MPSMSPRSFFNLSSACVAEITRTSKIFDDQVFLSMRWQSTSRGISGRLTSSLVSYRPPLVELLLLETPKYHVHLLHHGLIPRDCRFACHEFLADWSGLLVGIVLQFAGSASAGSKLADWIPFSNPCISETEGIDPTIESVVIVATRLPSSSRFRVDLPGRRGR